MTRVNWKSIFCLFQTPFSPPHPLKNYLLTFSWSEWLKCKSLSFCYILCSLLKLLFSRRFKLCWVLKTKNSKIRQSVTLFFFQTAFFWVLSIVGFEMAKNLKIRQIRHFLTTLLLENCFVSCFVYIFAESRDSLSLRESAVRPRKTERISRQNVRQNTWQITKN